MEETMMFKAVGEDVSAREVLQQVYAALQEKGYDPINQMVGYLCRVTLSISPATIRLAQ